MEKISPRVDLAFKKVFGVEENKDLLCQIAQQCMLELVSLYGHGPNQELAQSSTDQSISHLAKYF
jgi:hypothetical protein